MPDKLRKPYEPWKTTRPATAPVNLPYRRSDMAQYRGELYYGGERHGDRITIAKTADENYSSNEGFQRDGVGGQ